MKTFKTLKHFRYASMLTGAIDNALAQFLKEFKRKATVELFCSYVYSAHGELRDKSVRISFDGENQNEAIWFENYFDNLA